MTSPSTPCTATFSCQATPTHPSCTSERCAQCWETVAPLPPPSALVPSRSLDRVRDGRNFATRSVKAVQAGQAIFTAVMQFARPEEGKLMEHSDAMPHVPPPDDLPSLPERLGSLRTDPRIPDHLRSLVDKWLTMPFPIELRPVQPVVPDPLDPGPLPPHQLIWVRSKVPLGESADMHRCVAAFGSDWHLCTTSLLPHGMVFPTPALKMLTSLDHSMWFHAPFRADEWMLYEMRSPRATAARGLNVGRLFRADGTLAVSVAQEGLMRLR